MNLIFLLGLSQALVTVLAYTGTGAQQLLSDTSLQKFRTLCLMGTCVLEKMSLKKPWSNLKLIIPDLHVPDITEITSIEATSAPSRHLPSPTLAAHRCCSLTGGGGWQMLVEREIQDAGCHCSSWSSAMPEVRALLGQNRTRPLAQCLPCPTGLCQALWVIFADLGAAAQPGCSSFPVCRTLGGCEGLPEFEKCFLRDITKFLQCEPLMFSKTQAERTC